MNDVGGFACNQSIRMHDDEVNEKLRVNNCSSWGICLSLHKILTYSIYQWYWIAFYDWHLINTQSMYNDRCTKVRTAGHQVHKLYASRRIEWRPSRLERKGALHIDGWQWKGVRANESLNDGSECSLLPAKLLPWTQYGIRSAISLVTQRDESTNSREHIPIFRTLNSTNCVC